MKLWRETADMTAVGKESPPALRTLSCGRKNGRLRRIHFLKERAHGKKKTVPALGSGGPHHPHRSHSLWHGLGGGAPPGSAAARGPGPGGHHVPAHRIFLGRIAGRHVRGPRTHPDRHRHPDTGGHDHRGVDGLGHYSGHHLLGSQAPLSAVFPACGQSAPWPP